MSPPEPLLRQMEAQERRRGELLPEIADREDAVRNAGKIQAMTNPQVAKLMLALRDETDALDRDRQREFRIGLVDIVVLDAVAETLAFTYRLSATTRVRELASLI